MSDTAGAARSALPSVSTAESGVRQQRGEPGSSVLSPSGSSLRSAGSDTGDISDAEGDSSDANNGSAPGSPRMPVAPPGMDVPEGFHFTGDLEADLERLDALQEHEACSGL